MNAKIVAAFISWYHQETGNTITLSLQDEEVVVALHARNWAWRGIAEWMGMMCK